MISEKEPPSHNNNFILNSATFPDNAKLVAINAVYIVCVSQGQNFQFEFLNFFLMKLNKLFLLNFIVV